MLLLAAAARPDDPAVARGGRVPGLGPVDRGLPAPDGRGAAERAHVPDVDPHRSCRATVPRVADRQGLRAARPHARGVSPPRASARTATISAGLIRLRG